MSHERAAGVVDDTVLDDTPAAPLPDVPVGDYAVPIIPPGRSIAGPELIDWADHPTGYEHFAPTVTEVEKLGGPQPPASHPERAGLVHDPRESADGVRADDADDGADGDG